MKRNEKIKSKFEKLIQKFHFTSVHLITNKTVLPSIFSSPNSKLFRPGSSRNGLVTGDRGCKLLLINQIPQPYYDETSIFSVFL